MQYDEFISRNWLLIDNEIQDKIKNIKILLVGAGMGSQVVEVLVRMGFGNIIIADGDVVSLSNLNRQNYIYKDIGKNKAKTILKRIKDINPKAKIKCIKKFLYKKDLEKYIPQVDYIINTIDFDAKAFVECSDICRNLNKKEIFPINLGFGCAAFFFDKKSLTLSEYFDTIDAKELKIRIVKYCLTQSENNYLHHAFSKYLVSDVGYDPQNAISTYISAAMVSSLIISDLTSGVKTFPYLYQLDPLLK